MKEYIIKANVSGELADKCLNVLNASELVRCKDCVYGKEHCSYSVFGKPLYVCNHVRQIGREGLAIHTADWFCADGERK